MRRIIWFLSACIAIAPIAIEKFAAGADAPIDVRKEIGDRAFDILSGATRVQAFRIHEPPLPPGSNAPATAPQEKFGRYVIDEVAKDQGKAFAARLSGVLLDDNTYDHWHSLCFSPGVAYRVWKDRESVDVLLCFDCHHIRIGEKLLNMSRDHGASTLEKLVEESFPNDAKNEKPGQ